MTAFFKKKKEAGTAGATLAPKRKTKKDGDAKTVVATLDPKKEGNSGGVDTAMTLVRPHVTEKATDLSMRGVYVFDVHQSANKMRVRQAVEKLYKVKPVKIAMVNGKPKFMKNPRTGRLQVKQQGSKKALVYLKKGDKIEFV